MKETNNINVVGMTRLTSPAQLKEELPITDLISEVVFKSRSSIQQILDKKNPQLLFVVGPCSIHNLESALEYAKKLKELSEKVEDRFLLVMRSYFEKPRTTIGWKGFINDPNLNGSHDVEKGLHLARKLLLDINELGLPVAIETLDPITPQYLADLISWSAIGARTTESQTHREMASGLSMPVGFKNGTEGNLDIAVNALQAVSHPHYFLGIQQDSHVALIETKGNAYGHLVLRGGRRITNFDALSVSNTEDILRAENLRESIIVDCSHANSFKNHEKQEAVLHDIVRQIQDGNTSIIGVMLESNLGPGNQKISDNMQYGVSITDKCLDWENTERIILSAYHQLKKTGVLKARCNSSDV